MAKAPFLWKSCKTRSTATSSRSGCTMTGQRMWLVFFLPSSLNTFYFSDALMEECVRMMQQTLREAPSVAKRAKSVYSQRNLGTIKERKKEKKQEKDASSGETIMRILRMRYGTHFQPPCCIVPYFLYIIRSGTSEFIAQQLQIMAAMQAEQEQRNRKKTETRKLGRPRQNEQDLPAIPPLP